MKQLLKCMGSCCAGILVTWCLSAQPAISRVEYYLDKDPGYGKGTSVSFTRGTDLSDIAINLNPSGLSAGIHMLGVRAKNAKGAWSADNKFVFAKAFPADTTRPAPVPNLSRVEYYIDHDPGYGKATSVSFTAGTNLSDVAVNINPASLSSGIHFFGIRAKDAKGAWSPDNKFIFAKPYPVDTSGPAAPPNLSRVEYYIDHDPGYGKATSVKFVAGTNLSDIAINIDSSILTPGIHLFGIRAKNAKGGWSFDNKWLFARPYPDAPGPGRLPYLTNVEYYIDTDPGYGNATAASFTPGVNIFNIPIKINAAILTQGLHIMGIRAKNAEGGWSLDNKWLFAKPYSSASTAIPKLLKVEYYVDNDPGYGKGVPVIVKDSTNLSDIDLSINITGLSTGTHHLFIRSKDASKSWSLDNVFDFTVNSATTASSIVVNSISRRAVCPPDTLTMAYEAKGIYNSGNVFNVQLSDAFGSFVSPVVVGSYKGIANSVITCAIPSGLRNSSRYRLRVVSTNPVVTGISSTDPITVMTTHPAPVITPVGVVNICSGTTTSLTASGGFTAYLWSGGETTEIISVSTGGNYKVKVTDSYGCSGTSSTDTVKIIQVPDTLSSISGLVKVSALQQNIIYSVGYITGLNYAWTVPAGASVSSGQGTNSINVKWGTTSGVVSVKGSNDCGTSAVSRLSVSVVANVMANKFYTTPSYAATFKEEAGLYPNPANNTVTVAYTTAKADNYFIEVTDIAGKVLLIKPATSFYGINKTTLDVSKFSNGIYIVNLKDKQHTITSMKLNKQGL